MLTLPKESIESISVPIHGSLPGGGDVAVNTAVLPSFSFKPDPGDQDWVEGTWVEGEDGLTYAVIQVGVVGAAVSVEADLVHPIFLRWAAEDAFPVRKVGDLRFV
jgi:hypothetical protein